MKKKYEEPKAELFRLTFEDLLDKKLDLSTPEHFPTVDIGGDDGDDGDEWD